MIAAGSVASPQQREHLASGLRVDLHKQVFRNQARVEPHIAIARDLTVLQQEPDAVCRIVKMPAVRIEHFDNHVSAGRIVIINNVYTSRAIPSDCKQCAHRAGEVTAKLGTALKYTARRAQLKLSFVV